jgi:hypothetical protein
MTTTQEKTETETREPFRVWLDKHYDVTELLPAEGVTRPLDSWPESMLLACIEALERISAATAKHPGFPCEYFRLEDEKDSDPFLALWRAGRCRIFRLTNRVTGAEGHVAAIKARPEGISAFG